MNDFEKAHMEDVKLSRKPYDILDMPPLLPCRCGGAPIIDVSMALIHCEQCGLSFEYRYNRGVIPYHTWQLVAGKK